MRKLRESRDEGKLRKPSEAARQQVPNPAVVPPFKSLQSLAVEPANKDEQRNAVLSTRLSCLDQLARQLIECAQATGALRCQCQHLQIRPQENRKKGRARLQKIRMWRYATWSESFGFSPRASYQSSTRCPDFLQPPARLPFRRHTHPMTLGLGLGGRLKIL